MHKYLPSKRFVFILFSIILAFGLVCLASFLIKPKTVAVKLTEAEVWTKTQQFMALDSDSDGLKDWEEALWKTDPKKADTDGDGTTDGEEIKANRDPLKANTAKAGDQPNDLLDVKIIEANKKIDEDFAKLTQTDQLGRTLFSQYIASKSVSGAPLSDTYKQIILDTAISIIEVSNTPKYSISDIKVTNDLSTTSLKDYGNNLGQAFFTGTSQTKVDNEMDIINKATQTQDEKSLDDLDPIIESYGKTIAKMLLLAVPADIVSTHLKFLNDLYLIKIGLEETKKLFSDPVRAIGGIEGYQTSVASLKKDLPEIKSYFARKNIVFMPNEYGYVLLNVI